MRPLALLLLAGLLPTLPAQTLTVRDHGKPLPDRQLEALTRAIPPVEVTIHRRAYGEDRTYRALPFRPLLDHLYGQRWRRSEMVMMQCKDGYQPILATDLLIRHASDTRGFLAFDRVGGEELWEENDDGDEEDYGPLRLFWKGVDGKPPSRKLMEMPYQITGFDLIEFADRFPRIAPPKSASTQAKAGFEVFRQNCLKCHTLNGDGSDTPIGPELNYPMSVTEYWKRDVLERFLMEPESVRSPTKMPGLSHLPKTGGLPEEERRELARQLMAYLEAMAGKKLAPK